MTQEESPPNEAYFWIVLRTDREEIEIWSERDKAEASIDGLPEMKPGELYLYHVAESEIRRAFANRPIVAGDVEVDTTNKYIRKGWKPGMKK